MGTGWNTLGLDNTGMSWVFIIARTLQLYCTLVLEVLLDFSPHKRAVKRQMRVAKRWERKTSGPHVHWETEGDYFRTSDWIFPELFVSRLLVKGTMTLKTRLEWDKECYGKRMRMHVPQNIRLLLLTLLICTLVRRDVSRLELFLISPT